MPVLGERARPEITRVQELPLSQLAATQRADPAFHPGSTVELTLPVGTEVSVLRGHEKRRTDPNPICHVEA